MACSGGQCRPEIDARMKRLEAINDLEGSASRLAHTAADLYSEAWKDAADCVLMLVEGVVSSQRVVFATEKLSVSVFL